MAATDAVTRRLQLLLTLFAIVAIACNWWPWLDALAQDYLSETIGSNLIIFGVVRTLNGLISIIQSAEVGVGIASIGLGEFFDPVNDLIERFSALLLVTLTALGVQQVILLLTISPVMKVLFSLSVIIALAVLWRYPGRLSWVLRALLAVLLLRFLLSAQVGLIWLFDYLYFDTTGDEALSVLEGSAEVARSIRESLTSLDISQLIFGENSPALSEEEISTGLSVSVVTLIVGMLFKSLLIPTGTLWLGYKASKRLLLLQH